MAARNSGESPAYPGRSKIRGHRLHGFLRKVAEGKTNAALAKEYDVDPTTVGYYRNKYKDKIAAIKTDIENRFAGLWIAEKENRIGAYERDAEILQEIIDERAEVGWKECDCEDPECSAKKLDATALVQVIKRHHAALRGVAEELGQLPNRMNVQISGGEAPILHQIVGVDPDDV